MNRRAERFLASIASALAFACFVNAPLGEGIGFDAIALAIAFTSGAYAIECAFLTALHSERDELAERRQRRRPAA